MIEAHHLYPQATSKRLVPHAFSAIGYKSTLFRRRTQTDAVGLARRIYVVPRPSAHGQFAPRLLPKLPNSYRHAEER